MTSTRVTLMLLTLVACGCSRHSEPVKACEPPRPYWQQPHFIGGLQVPHVTVQVDHNSRVYFEGAPFRMGELTYQLGMTAKFDNPRVNVFLETEMGADCATVERVRDAFDAQLECKESGRCAEGMQSLWQHWPMKPGTPPS